MGEATIRKLKSKGVTSTWKVFGKFVGHMDEGVSLLDAASAFKTDLAEATTPTQHRDSVVSAVAERVYSGFQCPMVMDDERRKSSRMDHEKMEAFLAKDLTGDLEEDFNGIGVESAKKLKRAGVRTSWQLFGKALELDGDADEFEDFLTTNGTASGYKATVTHQVAERLANGLHLPDLSELRQKYINDEAPPSPVPYGQAKSPAKSPPPPPRSASKTVARESSGGGAMAVIAVAIFAIMYYFVMT